MNPLDSFSVDASPDPEYRLEVGTDSVIKNSLQISGFFEFEYLREGKTIGRGRFNGITTPGLNHMLSVSFVAGTQNANWYFFLIDNAGYSALSASDTMASHAGWVECTDYTEATRQAWGPAAPSGGSVTSTTQATFTINDTVTLVGAGLCSNSTKGGTTGVLFSTGLLGGTPSFANTDQIKLTYTLTLSLP